MLRLVGMVLGPLQVFRKLYLTDITLQVFRLLAVIADWFIRNLDYDLIGLIGRIKMLDVETPFR